MNNTIIIAEAGVNHNGQIDIAKKMIDVAHDSGVDYVKFQTFDPDLLIRKDTEMADYQKSNTGSNQTQYEMLKCLALDEDEFTVLAKYCKDIGIGFLSTPFDLHSVQQLCKLNMDYWKIASGEITNYPLLKAVAIQPGEVILSTGMCTMDDVAAAVRVLTDNGCDQVHLLHCTTDYPTAFEDANLNVMDSLREEFGLNVGYSDHTAGIEISVAAVAKGATIIEKHFTLDKTMSGPDQAASIEPHELKSMVQSIRNVEKALGSRSKQPTNAEKRNMIVARKSVMALRPIAAGEPFTEDNLCVKRPGTGLSPMMWENIIGKRASRNFEKDEMIVL